MRSPTNVRQRPGMSGFIAIAVLAIVTVLASLLLGSAGPAQAGEPPRSSLSHVPRVEPGCDTGELDGEYVVCCWDETGHGDCTGIV